VAEDDAEAIGADPADDVGVAQAAVQQAADGDHHGVRGVEAEGVVDGAELVDAHDEICAGDAVAARRPQRMFQGVAQAHAIVMAGQFVVIGEIFELRLARLARAHQTQDARDRQRLAGGVAPRDPAVMDPDRIVVVVADAVLAFVCAGAGEMPRQRLGAQRRVLGEDPRGEAVRGAKGGELLAQRVGDGAEEVERARPHVPRIGDVAGGADRLDEAPVFHRCVVLLARAGHVCVQRLLPLNGWHSPRSPLTHLESRDRASGMVKLC